MGKIREDLNAFKEQQRELNQDLIERLNSLKVQTKRSNENTEAISTIVQIKNILEKLISFDDRLKRIEELNPVDNQVEKCIISEIRNSSKILLLLLLLLFKKKIIIITITMSSVLKITITIILLLLKFRHLKTNMMNAGVYITRVFKLCDFIGFYI
jgi:hypothetical protein